MRSSQVDSQTSYPRAVKLMCAFGPVELAEMQRVLQKNEIAWQEHVNRNAYDGKWDVLPLRCMKKHRHAHQALQSFNIEDVDDGEEWDDLAMLDQFPAIKQCLECIECPIKSVRLMRLHPRSNILPHRDACLGIQYSELRLHIPIILSDNVEFFVDGERIAMSAGELWYIASDREHWVNNNSDQLRIHLVIDCRVNDWVQWKVLGKESMLSLTDSMSPKMQVEALVKQFHSSDESYPGVVKQSSDALFSCIGELVEFTDYCEQLNHNDHTNTSQGKACSSNVAAMCTAEYMRNLRFQQGILRAIEDRLKNNRPVELLYAGSGPFGSLVIPVLLLLKPGQVRVTVIDIHQASLDRVKRLVDVLELNEFIVDYHCADAAQWQPEPRAKYDIIVSETMKAMLEEEPQLAVFLNLERFLKPSGTFIPEKISLQAWLVNSRTEYEQLFSNPVTPATPPKHLSDLFSLDREKIIDIRDRGITEASNGSFSMPDNVENYNLLHYQTIIDVYDDVILNKNQSSLTCPKVESLSSDMSSCSISFHYDMGAYPEFKIMYK